MAKYSESTWGKISGTHLDAVGSSWKGIKYLRKKGSHKDARTEAQLLQREKFSKLVKVLNPMSDFLNYSCGAAKMTGVNRAFQANMKGAVNGTSPDNVEIDFTRLKVAIGDLAGMKNANTTYSGGATMVVTYQGNAGNGSAKRDDHSMLMVYNATLNACQYVTNGPQRGENGTTQSIEVSIPASWTNSTLYVYGAMKGRKATSSSELIATIQI